MRVLCKLLLSLPVGSFAYSTHSLGPFQVPGAVLDVGDTALHAFLHAGG